MPKIVKNKVFQTVTLFTILTTILFIAGMGLFFNSKSVWGQVPVPNANNGVQALYCDVEWSESPVFCAIVSGVKFEDLNQDGIKDPGEPLLNGWEICQESSQEPGPPVGIPNNVDFPDCVITGSGNWSDGYYEFVFYSGRVVTLSETLQDGWTQTAPVGGVIEVNNGISIGPTEYPDNDFGNYLLPFCGDEVVNQETEQCDGTDGVGDNQVCEVDCTLTDLPFCGDGVVNQESEQCDGTDGISGDQTCSDTCTVIEPALIPFITLDKTDSQDPVLAGGEITYTLSYSVVDASVTGLTLTDTLPANTSYVSASNGGVYDSSANTVTWDLGNVDPGDYSVTLTVKVAGVLANGTVLTNTGVLNSNETPEHGATEPTTVNSAPSLVVSKAVEKDTINPGDSVNFIATVKNNGSETAYNLRLADTMHIGFTYDDGSAGSWFFSDLVPGEEKVHIYSMTAGLEVEPGSYFNTIQASADNHDPVTADARVDVVALPGVVLGEAIEAPVKEGKVLAATGSSMFDYAIYLVALIVSVIGLFTVKRLSLKK